VSVSLLIMHIVEVIGFSSSDKEGETGILTIVKL
jgi:hypothetical protein